MNEFPEPDPCADILGKVPLMGQSRELRQAILKQTTRIVRRRVWIRRGIIASSLAACYVAGLLTMHWTAPSPRRLEAVASNQDIPDVKMPGNATQSDTPLPPAEASAEILEQWGPLVDLEKRAALYRRAGDRYYADNNDLQGALRCYRQALDSGSKEDLQIAVNDNWLLIALKEARTKEKSNATN